MFGRTLPVPQACSTGVARFSFPDLCAKPLGAADYIALSRCFHTVFLTDIPAFSMQVSSAPRSPPANQVNVLFSPLPFLFRAQFARRRARVVVVFNVWVTANMT
mgnify:CR=1 FL=1